MDELLLRYSKSPKIQIARSPQATVMREIKPVGLWVSVGTAWKEWCEGEGFALESLRYCFKVTLAEGANILRLTNGLDIDLFTRDFEADHTSSGIPGMIDWPLVQQGCDGIIISPYIWSRRLTPHTFWYYGWDCASWCIWNPKAIAGIEPYGETAQEESGSSRRIVELGP